MPPYRSGWILCRRYEITDDDKKKFCSKKIAKKNNLDAPGEARTHDLQIAYIF